MTEYSVSENDMVVLVPKSKGAKIGFRIENRSQKIAGLGVYNPGKLIGMEYGKCIKLGKNTYWILPANTLDHIETMRRKAQIILPKDAALLGLYCNIKPGSTIVEGGLGSGALTIVLLSLVGPSGKVITYEVRDDFSKIGSRNIERVSPEGAWVLKQQDITDGISEKNINAVILDIPEPWSALDTIYQALLPGGVFAGYIPTMNQVEKLVVSLKKLPFIEIHTFENIQRELVVKPGATRPAYDMLGHTGYITIARKVTEKID